MLSSYWDDFPSRSPMGWRMPLQVQRKGGFFTDSLFQGTRNHFDSAIRDVMRGWDVNNTNDHFKSYRMIRDRQLSGTDRPSSLVEEDTIYKVVMDVQGFIENDLKVTFLNDNELVVEGMIEKKTEGSISRQSFKRRFVFAKQVIASQATSALSSDNVLTITIPKQLQQITAGDQTSALLTNTSSLQNQAVSSGLGQMVQDSSTSQNMSSSLARNDLFDTSLHSLMEFPISRKNDFLADSFFDNVRGMFQSRVQEIMNRRSKREAIEDVNIFRNLRDKEDQNVAVTVAGDTTEHKIVLDVHGFTEGDLKVKAITENELLVEGKVERKTDNSCCHNSFRRNFSLPSNVNLQGATSALSSDGVLTIIVPKKPEKPLPIEYSIPVTRVDAPSQSSKSSKREEKLSELQSRQGNILPTPIPLGYADSQMSDTQNILSTQQKYTGNECVIPVTVEGTPQPMADDITQKLQNSSLTTASESISSSNRTQSSQRMDESMSQDLRSNVTQKSTTDQSWKDVQIAPKFNSKVIPINMRGSFCNDSVFDSARRRVESAVQNAIRRSTSRDQQTEVQNTTQKNLISANTTAVSTILDDVNNYKISLDVYGFSEKDLSVRIVSRNEISVEGVTESRKDGSVTRHSFERTFHLPDTVNTERVTSDLSSEGMLTITLPKKVDEIPSGNVTVSHDTAVKTQASAQSLLSEASKETASGVREYVVPLTLEDSSASLLQKDLLQTKQKMSSDMGSAFDSRSSVSTDVQSSEQAFKSNLISQSTDASREASQIRDIAIKPCFDLPISNKGHFYQDSFFNDSRDMFDVALRNTMNRFSSFTAFPNDSDFFNTLRQERVGSESQTAALSEDNQFHKVVVDVQGYPQECLKVKVLEGNGILVEGKVEETTGCAASTRTFQKTFFLPQLYDAGKAVTALSSDGILSIKVPRRS